MPTILQIRPLFFLILFVWTWYLVTIAPSVLFFDSPEFINTAFTLGISHPAGFPLYNMLAKNFTLFPLGSIPFRVNLFSAVVSMLALGLLAGAGITLLRILFPDRKPGLLVWSVLVPVGYLAISKPYWLQSLQAEVYSLHVALTAGLMFLMFLWKLRDDIRFLYGAGLLFGLSAGNHATVAFYLPAVLILFFCWCREQRWLHLTRCICLFLLGLSIYAYLPLRSFSEPSFDFGNPETIDGFMYQVTDRRHSDFHFKVFSDSAPDKSQVKTTFSQQAQKATDTIFLKAKNVVTFLFKDFTGNLSWVCLVGLLIGGALCYKRSRPIFIFLLVVAGGNIAFFYGWGRESLFPTYTVACLLTAIMLAHFLDSPWSAPVAEKEEEQEAGLRWRPIAWAVLILLIPFNTVRNLMWADLADIYSGDGLVKKVYLKLENNSLFLPGMSWFYYYYLQDVERLRDDVTAIPAWELLSGNPPDMLTDRRYPDLKLPEPSKYDFSSYQNIESYNKELFRINQENRPILLEHNPIYFHQTRLASDFIPNRVLLVKYAPSRKDSADFSGMVAWQDFAYLTDEEIKRSFDEENPLQGVGGLGWGDMPKLMLMGTISYAQDTGRYELEAEALTMQFKNFTGDTAAYYSQWLENRLNVNKPDEAKAALKILEEKFSDTYETRLARGKMAEADGQADSAISHFLQAAEVNPAAIRPHLELAKLHAAKNDFAKAQQAMEKAKARITNLRELAQYDRRGREIQEIKPGTSPG